jgi:hypothetical protein
MCDRACFVEKTLYITVPKSNLEHFDGCLRAKMYMLAEINIGKASLAYKV